MFWNKWFRKRKNNQTASASKELHAECQSFKACVAKILYPHILEMQKSPELMNVIDDDFCCSVYTDSHFTNGLLFFENFALPLRKELLDRIQHGDLDD